MATAEKVATQQKPPAEARSKGEVALINPPRLQYHPLVQERFGIDRAGWRALTDAVFPSARTTDAVVLALSYCKARKLDPFKRVVHIVPVWDPETQGYVETVWPGIAEHRTTAFRTKQYAGADACTFGPTISQLFSGKTKKGDINVTIKFPEWAQLTVYRLIDGQRVAVPGPRVYWLETYARIGRTTVPNDMWQKRPFGQIEKCAEAAALRRAFPEELGGDVTAEEAGSEGVIDVSAEGVDERAPQRSDFAENGAQRRPEPQTEPEPEMFELIDEVGEVLGELTAGGWADELISRTSRLQGRDRASFLENNEAAAKLVWEALPEGAQAEQLRALYAEPEVDTGEPDGGEQASAEPQPIEIPKKPDGKPMWASYLQTFKAQLADISDAAEIEAFGARELESVAKAGCPNGTLNTLKLEIGRRRGAVASAQ